MTEFLTAWALATWQVLADSALYFLMGLVLAGLVWIVLNEENLRTLLGRNRNRAVYRAALLGVPLPLCSCSVLPVASQLRASGLSKGGTVSFLISTPESSVDSILLTYSLTDPLLTVARPIAAFLTAVAAGLFENSFHSEASPAGQAGDSTPICECDSSLTVDVNPAGWSARIVAGFKHSFTTLIGDLAPYLLLGYALAGLTAAVVGSPLDMTSGGVWWSYLAALVIGVPLYICATSSTPLAAVLLGAGFPPGAIMVFLMVGPATNLATLTVTKRILGMASTVRYVVSIVVVSLICGLVLDWLYHLLQIDPSYRVMAAGQDESYLQLVAGIILAGLILYHSASRTIRKLSC